MTWSFSRLNSYHHCPYEFKLHYIECNKSKSSAMAQFGTLMHTILEKYAKGELSIFEISQYYEEHFDQVITERFPYNKYVDLRESYYQKGLDYLNNINLILDDYEILGVELKVEFEISGRPFIGFIDLLLRDKKTGEIIILDHKSSSLKFKKNGEISKTDAAHFLEFQRQLYLYSIPVIKEYGKVSFLEWNMFKDQKFVKIPWTEEGYHDAIKWAEDTLTAIENEKEWLPNNSNQFYCRNLCGQRENACEFKM